MTALSEVARKLLHSYLCSQVQQAWQFWRECAYTWLLRKNSSQNGKGWFSMKLNVRLWKKSEQIFPHLFPLSGAKSRFLNLSALHQFFLCQRGMNLVVKLFWVLIECFMFHSRTESKFNENLKLFTFHYVFLKLDYI